LYEKEHAGKHARLAQDRSLDEGPPDSHALDDDPAVIEHSRADRHALPVQDVGGFFQIEEPCGRRDRLGGKDAAAWIGGWSLALRSA